MAESQIHDCNLLCILHKLSTTLNMPKDLCCSQPWSEKILPTEDSGYFHRLITPQSSENRYLFILRVLGSR